MWNKQTHKWIYKLSVSGRACETTSGPTGGRSREVEERGPDAVEGGEELEQGWGRRGKGGGSSGIEGGRKLLSLASLLDI